MPAWLDHHVFGNPLAGWLLATGTVLLALGVVAEYWLLWKKP